MKHLLNNLSEEEKNSIREQHNIVKSILVEDVNTSEFNSSLSQIKSLASELKSVSQSLKQSSPNQKIEASEQATSTTSDISAIKGAIAINLILVGKYFESLVEYERNAVLSSDLSVRLENGNKMNETIQRIIELLSGVTKELQKI
jgi:hypothetical protein